MKNFLLISLSVFWIFALFNPVFMKYDYGAGWPVVLVFAVLMGVLGVLEFRGNRERCRIEMIFLLIFGASVLVSFYFSQTKNVGLSEVVAFLSVIPLYLTFAYQKNDWMRGFLRVVAVSSVVAAVLGYVFYFVAGEPRMFGPFFNILYHANVWPNAFALFLLMVWPVFLLFFNDTAKVSSALLSKNFAPHVSTNTLRSKFFCRLASDTFAVSLFLSIVISALFLTFSRGALIAFLGQIVLLGIFFIKKIRIKTVLMGTLILVVSCGLFFGANYLRSLQHDVIDLDERVTFDNQESLTSKQERVDFWLGAIELIKEKPLTGWGPFSFRYAYNPIQKTFLGSADHPHNLFLKIAAENGLIALGGFVLFLLSVFLVVARRFRKISGEKRGLVAVLGVAVLGAFAHNLIDYNFNFFANLFLLFLFLGFLRSFVARDSHFSGNDKNAYAPLVLGIALGIFALYEGIILTLAETIDEDYLEHSYYPRNYYLEVADQAIQNEDYLAAMDYVDLQLNLNSMDAQAWYLKGVVCESAASPEFCMQNYKTALELDPMNEIEYHRKYFEMLIETDAHLAGVPDFEEALENMTKLLELYFGYVQNNVHFTAYTSNVEAASGLADALAPHMATTDAANLYAKRDKMLEKAYALRAEKEF